MLAFDGEPDHIQRRHHIELMPVGVDLVETVEDPGQRPFVALQDLDEPKTPVLPRPLLPKLSRAAK